MIGFYAVRKLVDSRVLTDSRVTRLIPVRVYPKKRETTITRFDRHDIVRHYDINRERLESRPLLFVCNQVVHSYVFSLLIQENGGLESIVVCSDKERQSKIFRIEIRTIAELFESIGHDRVRKMWASFDTHISDYIVRNLSENES